MTKPAFLLGVLLSLTGLLAGCDYPEAGYFEIAVRDGSRQIASFPFMIEELTDDTDLTIGFNVLLPRNGELVLYNLKNSPDLTRRGWELRLGQGDSGHGDLQLLLFHANDQLSFSGTQRDPGAGQSARFRGTDLQDFSGSVASSEQSSPGAITFGGRLPATLLDGDASEARWQIRAISQAQFEKALGTTVATAPRREAPYLAPLRVELPQAPQKAEVRPGRFKRDKPGGERRVGP